MHFCLSNKKESKSQEKSEYWNFEIILQVLGVPFLSLIKFYLNITQEKPFKSRFFITGINFIILLLY